MAEPRILIGNKTDPGKVRELNEDTLGTPGAYKISWEQQQQRGVLVALADGMGGHAAGEVASKMAVDTLFKTFYTSTQRDPRRALQECFAAANKEVYELASSDPTKRNMGTTMVAALIREVKKLLVANVGDSRAFLIRGKSIRQITRDHSLVAEQVRAGLITEEEARQNTYRNVITRAVGIESELKVDLFGEKLERGDLVVLCSDGLSNKLEPNEIREIVQSISDPQAAAQKLIVAANERGAEDNISAIVISGPA